MFIHWVPRKVLKTETGDPTLLHVQMDPVQDNVNANMFNLNLHKYMYNILCYFWHHLSLVLRKPVFRVSDQVRHKPGCTATEDGWRLEISDLESKGIVLSV